nr:galactosyltransferase-related protein [uncultured Bacteroides sp.]
MKILLKDITFCIPIRIESLYRLENLICLLKYITKYFDTNLYILEADKQQKFHNYVDISNIKYQFIKDESPIFFRTKYINQMLATTSTPFAAIWDTDAIAPIEQIRTAHNILRKNDTALVYPYSGIFFSVNEYLSILFKRDLDINVLNSKYLCNNLLNGYYSVGGAYMVNIKMYNEAGGENEHFYGWGPEDAERRYRLQILKYKVIQVEGVLYHLYHTRGLNSQYSNIENAIKSKNELCKICSMTNSELKLYIQSWHSINE